MYVIYKYFKIRKRSLCNITNNHYKDYISNFNNLLLTEQILSTTQQELITFRHSRNEPILFTAIFWLPGVHYMTFRYQLLQLQHPFPSL
jgi:hypothetical protein